MGNGDSHPRIPGSSEEQRPCSPLTQVLTPSLSPINCMTLSKILKAWNSVSCAIHITGLLMASGIAGKVECDVITALSQAHSRHFTDSSCPIKLNRCVLTSQGPSLGLSSHCLGPSRRQSREDRRCAFTLS